MMTAPLSNFQLERGVDDRTALTSIVAFWAAWLLLVTARAGVMGWPDQAGMLLRRMGMAAVGVALAWIVHRLLARVAGRSLALQSGSAFLLCIPVTTAFAVLNTLVFYRWFPVASVAGDLARWDPQAVIVTAIADGLVTWYFFFAAWVAFYLAFGHVAEVRSAGRSAARAQDEAQDARLAMLRLQVDPHFLFNAMSALSSLVAQGETKPAGAMIRDLAVFFRAGLVTDPAADITLGEEIEFQRLYLAIERARFGERLDVAFDVPDQFLSIRIPALIIQPLVENAVKHGLGTTNSPIRITITARCESADLHLSVVDHAEGHRHKVEPISPSTGIGLANVRARLATRFGSKARLDAYACPGGWLSKIVRRRDMIDRLRHEGGGAWAAVLDDGTVFRIGRSYLEAVRSRL